MKRAVTITGSVVLVALILFLGLHGWRRKPPPALPPPDSRLVSALRSHVEFLAGGLGERNAVHYSNLRRAEDYIAREFAAAGYSVQTQSYRIGEKTYSNLVASKTGKTDPREVVIVGAHYDTAATPGADDNASGVAGLLELARLFSGEETARTLRCRRERLPGRVDRRAGFHPRPGPLRPPLLLAGGNPRGDGPGRGYPRPGRCAGVSPDRHSGESPRGRKMYAGRNWSEMLW